MKITAAIGTLQPFIFAAMDAGNDLFVRWMNLEQKLVERFGKKPDLEAVLFLVGIQEFGQVREKYTKEQKQDLIHVAVCSLLSQSGYFEFEKYDDEGWPHFKQLKAMPAMSLKEQEDFIKDHVLLYFEQSGF
ncbi:MAG: hypothetical protein QM725_16370 [Lacibacter sp.]